MFIDTHCHINIMIRNFNSDKNNLPLTQQEILEIQDILNKAQEHQVTEIINVGTNLTESNMCIQIGQHFKNCFSTIGIHPNDIESDWNNTIEYFDTLLEQKKRTENCWYWRVWN